MKRMITEIAALMLAAAIAATTGCATRTAGAPDAKTGGAFESFEAGFSIEANADAAVSEAEGGASSDDADGGPVPDAWSPAQAASGGGSAHLGDDASSGGSAGQAHRHSWEPQPIGTKQVWVEVPGWNEQVVVGDHIHCTCGLDWYDETTYFDHVKEALCRYTVVTDMEWIHHDKTGHYEERTIYQMVCTECGTVVRP